MTMTRGIAQQRAQPFQEQTQRRAPANTQAVGIDWVPVARRVPDDRREVLVWGFRRYIGGNDIPAGRFLGISRCNLSRFWTALFDCERGFFDRGVTVTHWAEISGPEIRKPAPPAHGKVQPTEPWPAPPPPRDQSTAPPGDGATVITEVGYYSWVRTPPQKKDGYQYETFAEAEARAIEFIRKTRSTDEVVVVRAVAVLRRGPGFTGEKDEADGTPR